MMKLAMIRGPMADRWPVQWMATMSFKWQKGVEIGHVVVFFLFDK
jgi:hypothetical protein